MDRSWLRRIGEASDVWEGGITLLDRELVNSWRFSVGSLRVELGTAAASGWTEEDWVLVEAAADEH